MAFPVHSGGDGGDVRGVVEFFSTRMEPPDEDLIRTVATVGNQVGQFLQRRRAEDELHASHALHRGILEAALDCIIGMDDRGRVIEWNPAARGTFGYGRDEVLGRELAELIVPPELRPMHREGLARYLRTGEGPVLGRKVEVTALRADGTRVPVELAITPILLPGRPPTFIAYVQDIGERKRSEERLREAAERFRTLADNMAQLAWMAGSSGSVVWYNKRWYDYTGAMPEEMTGLGWQKVHHPDHVERVTRNSSSPWRRGSRGRTPSRSGADDGDVPLVPVAAPADPRRGRAGGAVVRHQHRRHRAAGNAAAAGGGRAAAADGAEEWTDRHLVVGLSKRPHRVRRHALRDLRIRAHGVGARRRVLRPHPPRGPSGRQRRGRGGEARRGAITRRSSGSCCRPAKSTGRWHAAASPPTLKTKAACTCSASPGT